MLIDTALAGVTETLEKITKKVNRGDSVNRIRVRSIGPKVFIDITIAVVNNLSIEQAHAICDAVEKEIHKLEHDADITIHAEPHGK